MLEKITASELLKTEGIITALPNDTLSSALSHLRSSHDAVFITEDEKLLGVVSPYYTLFKGKFPPETKVKSCLFHPPKIFLSTPLPEIARKMVESKVYYLPVYDDKGAWVGIITQGKILQLIAQDGTFTATFEPLIREKPLVTTTETATIGQIRSVMTHGGVSRLVVTDSRGLLKGIITRFDLRQAFSRPQQSVDAYSRVGEKDHQADLPIRPYIKRSVFTASIKSAPHTIVQEMLDHDIGSVVLVDSQFRPVGLVSVKDFLGVLAQAGGTKPQVVIHVDAEFPDAVGFRVLLEKLKTNFEKHHPLTAFVLHHEGIRNSAGTITRHEVKLRAQSSGKNLVTRTSHPEWQVALREAFEKLSHQVE